MNIKWYRTSLALISFLFGCCCTFMPSFLVVIPANESIIIVIIINILIKHRKITVSISDSNGSGGVSRRDDRGTVVVVVAAQQHWLSQNRNGSESLRFIRFTGARTLAHSDTFTIGHKMSVSNRTVMSFFLRREYGCVCVCFSFSFWCGFSI